MTPSLTYIQKSQDVKQKFNYCPNAVGVFKAKCECGKIYYRVAGCNREICPYCGQKDSPLHRQTFRRWIPKAKWLLTKKRVVGYLVITFPESKRDLLKNRKHLREIMQKVKQVLLKKFGVRYLKMRWHWAGEKSKKWHPHLNIICDKRFFEEIKKLRECLIETLECDNIVIHHQYLRDIERLIHCIRYITRPTLLLIEDENERWEIWEIIRGFRNDAWAGKWGKEELSLRDIKQILQNAENKFKEGDWKEYIKICLDVNVCPICGKRLKWKWERMEIWKLEEYCEQINIYYLSDFEFT